MTGIVARYGKYGAVFRMAFAQAGAEGISTLGRMAFYAVILLIFSRLWTLLVQNGALKPEDAPRLLFYLAVTEWVVLSIPGVHLEIEADVRRGDVATQLPRPMSYVGGRSAEALGTLGFRLLALAPAGILIVALLGGRLPEQPVRLIQALIAGACAAAVLLMFHSAIGLTAFWLEDVSPVYWMWQKLAFLCGGLMLPLDVYPDWFASLCGWTPFAALIYGPAQLVLVEPQRSFSDVVVAILGWGGFAIFILWLLSRRALRALEVIGG